jgi:hypothetical protein
MVRKGTDLGLNPWLSFLSVYIRVPSKTRNFMENDSYAPPQKLHILDRQTHLEILFPHGLTPVSVHSRLKIQDVTPRFCKDLKFLRSITNS